MAKRRNLVRLLPWHCSLTTPWKHRKLRHGRPLAVRGLPLRLLRLRPKLRMWMKRTPLQAAPSNCQMLNWADGQDTLSDVLVGVSLPLSTSKISYLLIRPTFDDEHNHMIHTYPPDMMYYLRPSSDMIPPPSCIPFNTKMNRQRHMSVCLSVFICLSASANGSHSFDLYLFLAWIWFVFLRPIYGKWASCLCSYDDVFSFYLFLLGLGGDILSYGCADIIMLEWGAFLNWYNNAFMPRTLI